MIPVTVVAKEYLSDNRTCTLAEDGTVTTEGHTPAFQTALKEAFLPAGWPDSVTTDYLGTLQPRIFSFLKPFLAVSFKTINQNTGYTFFFLETL